MGSWLNNDGLLIAYGQSEALASPGGDYEVHGSGLLVLDFLIPLTSVVPIATAPVYANIFNQTNAAAAGFVSSNLIPNNMLLEKVEIYTEVAAATSTSATLFVGTWDLTTNTSINPAGLVNALPIASINAAGLLTTLTAGATNAGGQLGAVLYNGGGPGPIVAHQLAFTVQTSTGTYTAGKLRLRAYLRRSLATDTSSSVDD